MRGAVATSGFHAYLLYEPGRVHISRRGGPVGASRTDCLLWPFVVNNPALWASEAARGRCSPAFGDRRRRCGSHMQPARLIPDISRGRGSTYRMSPRAGVTLHWSGGLCSREEANPGGISRGPHQRSLTLWEQALTWPWCFALIVARCCQPPAHVLLSSLRFGAR